VCQDNLTHTQWELEDRALFSHLCWSKPYKRTVSSRSTYAVVPLVFL
jgi:hypothetical protein